MAKRNQIEGDVFQFTNDTDFFGYDSGAGLFRRPQKMYAVREITIGGTITAAPATNPTLNFATVDGVAPAQTVGGLIQTTNGTAYLGLSAFFVNAPLTTMPLILGSSCTPGTTDGTGSMLFVSNKANAAPAATDIQFEWGYQAAGAFVSQMKLLGDGTLQVMGVDVTPAAGSDQGSVYAWDTTVTAGYKDTVRAWNCLATDVIGTALRNTTPSVTDVAGRVQNSPISVLGGRAFRVDTSDDQAWDWGMQVRPVAGASAATTSAMHFLSRRYIGGAWGAFEGRAYLDSAGTYVSSYERALAGTDALGLLIENATLATSTVTAQRGPIMAVGAGSWDSDFGAGADGACQFRLGFQVIAAAGATPYSYVRLAKQSRTGGPAAFTAWSAWAATGFEIIDTGGLSVTTITATQIAATAGGIFGGAAALGSGGTTTYTTRTTISNTSASAVQGVQESPSLRFTSNAADNGTPLASSTIYGQQFDIKVLPTGNIAAPTATMYWGFRQTAGTLGSGTVPTVTGNFATAMSLTSGGTLTTTASISVGSSVFVNGSNGTFTYGNAYGIVGAIQVASQTNVELLFHSTARTSAANGRVITAAWGQTAAQIATASNYETMRVMDFGIGRTDATAAFLSVASVRANGDLFFNGGTNAQSLAIKSLTEETTLAVGEATKDTTIQIPAGAVVLAVTGRVTTGSGVVSTVDIGVSGALTRYATGIDISAAGATWLGTMDAARYYAAATAITITPNAALETDPAKLRITIHFYLPTAPTS